MRTLFLCLFVLLLSIAGASAQIEEEGGGYRSGMPNQPGANAELGGGHSQTITDLDFSPDGSRIITCSEDKTLRLWRTDSGELVRTISCDDKPKSVRFAPSGLAILADFPDGSIGKWSIVDGSLQEMLQGAGISPNEILAGPDGTRWIAAGSDGRIFVMTNQLRILRTFPTKFASVEICALAMGGQTAICIPRLADGTNASPFALNLRTGRRTRSRFAAATDGSVYFSPDHAFAVTTDPGGHWTVRRANTGTSVISVDANDKERLIFTRDSNAALLVDTTAGTIELVSTTSWQPLTPKISGSFGDIIALSPDGSSAAFVDSHESNRFRMLSIRTGDTDWESPGKKPTVGNKPATALLEQLTSEYLRFGLPQSPGIGAPALREASDSRPSIESEVELRSAAMENSLQSRSTAYHVGYMFHCNSDLCLAVDCALQGPSPLGLKYLARAQDSCPGDVRQALAAAAWVYWENALLDTRTDRNAAAKYLHRIYDDFGPLQTEHKKSLLADLDLTLAAGSIRHNDIEGDVDDLSTAGRASRSWIAVSGNPANKIHDVIKSLNIRGFEAIPILLRHIEDRRLTHEEFLGMANVPPHIMRVGEVISELLFEISGKQTIMADDLVSGELRLANRRSAERWWQHASAVGEERYLVDNVLPDRDVEQEHANINLTLIIAARYSNKLPGVYDQLVKRYPKSQLSEITELLAVTNVGAEEKSHLFRAAATTTAKNQRIEVLQTLLRVGYSGTAGLLAERLDSLPAKAEGPIASGEPVALACMVKVADTPEAWAALDRLAKRSVPWQRLQILSQLTDICANEPRQRHQVEFLTSYLSDDTVCSLSNDPDSQGSPKSDCDVETLTIRDRLLRSLCTPAGVHEYPAKDWTAKQWEVWRPRVVDALRPYLKNSQSALNFGRN